MRKHLCFRLLLCWLQSRTWTAWGKQCTNSPTSMSPQYSTSVNHLSVQCSCSSSQSKFCPWIKLGARALHTRAQNYKAIHFECATTRPNNNSTKSGRPKPTLPNDNSTKYKLDQTTTRPNTNSTRRQLDQIPTWPNESSWNLVELSFSPLDFQSTCRLVDLVLVDLLVVELSLVELTVYHPLRLHTDTIMLNAQRWFILEQRTFGGDFRFKSVDQVT
jgi:hypothetical protein